MKLDRYGPTLFVVIRPAIYLDTEHEVSFGEIHCFAGEVAVGRRIYELFSEVTFFQKATRPLIGMLDGLLRGRET